MTSTFTISHTIDQEILDRLEVEFDDFRSRIASLSALTGDTLTAMFQPLGPVDTEVIDITSIESKSAELVLVPQPQPEETDAVVFEFAVA